MTWNIGARPEKAFAGLALVLGLAFAFLMPPFQVPDEFGHFMRGYQGSQGKFLLDRVLGGGDFPSAVQDAFEHFLPLPFHPERKISRREIFELLAASPDNGEPPTFHTLKSLGAYAPYLYFPQAVGVGVGRLFGGSPLALMYLGRIANLLCAILLVALAIRITPILKWGFCVLALTPMALHQMSSLSADVVMNGLSFLFTAMVARCAFSSSETLPRSEVVAVALLGALIAVGKLTYFPLLLLWFLIPPKKLGGIRRYAVATAMVFAFVGLASLGWAVYADPFVPRVSCAECGYEAQKQWVLGHPWDFAKVIAHDYAWRSLAHVEELIGKLGWTDTPLPPLLLLTFAVLTLRIARLDSHPTIDLDLLQRVVVFAAVFLAATAVLSVCYLLWSPIAGDLVGAVQGRYFIPLTPAALLLCYRRRDSPAVGPAVLGALAMALVTLSSVYSLRVVYYRYYADTFVPHWASDKPDPATARSFAEAPLQLSFHCPVDTLRDLDVLVQGGGRRRSTANFRIRLSEGGQVLAEGSGLARGRDRKWLVLSLPQPLRQCRGRLLSAEIEALEPKTDDLKVLSYPARLRPSLAVASTAEDPIPALGFNGKRNRSLHPIVEAE
jgi:uncharacterized membrane protein